MYTEALRKKKLNLKIGRDKIEKYVIDFLKEQIQLVDIGSPTGRPAVDCTDSQNPMTSQNAPG